jgi:hypothetical protein
MSSSHRQEMVFRRVEDARDFVSRIEKLLLRFY